MQVLVAVEVFQAHRVNLQEKYDHPILLDVNLPGMDGYAVLQALRAHPRTVSVPVVAVSADALRAHRERGLAAGFHDYLAKPLDLEQLLAVMAALAAAAGR